MQYSWPWPPYMFHPSAPEYSIYSSCLLVVLTLAWSTPLTLALFCRYLIMFLLPHLMSCLAQNYKVPMSWNYSTVHISKSSGSTPAQLRHVLTLTLASCISNSCSLSCLTLNLGLTPWPQTYVWNTWTMTEGRHSAWSCHELKPMSRSLHLASLQWSSVPTLNFKSRTLRWPEVVLVHCNSIYELKTFWILTCQDPNFALKETPNV